MPEVLGIEQRVPLLDGSHVRYVNLDNAASTPPLVHVMNRCKRFFLFTQVFIGAVDSSRDSVPESIEQARQMVAQFVNADQETDTVIFGKNTTEAINKLSYRIAVAARRRDSDDDA